MRPLCITVSAKSPVHSWNKSTAHLGAPGHMQWLDSCEMNLLIHGMHMRAHSSGLQNVFQSQRLPQASAAARMMHHMMSRSKRCSWPSWPALQCLQAPSTHRPDHMHEVHVNGAGAHGLRMACN
jgi:hypothetical protein